MEDNWFLEWALYESKLTKIEEDILGPDNDFSPVKERILYEKEEQITIDKFNWL